MGKLVAYQDNIEGCRNYSESTDGNGEIVNENAPAYNYNRHRVTYEEFLEISANSDERYEYIDGEVYLLASPKTTHQRILVKMFGTFYNWFEGKKCPPMTAPYDITLQRNENNKNVVQPDLMVICDLDEKLGDDDYYSFQCNGVTLTNMVKSSYKAIGGDSGRACMYFWDYPV